jgi:PAS domain S-box-containing protein
MTEHKQAEAALRESEEKYRVLVETTNTGFLILNNEGRVIDANAEYVRLTGYRELGDILGKTVTEWTAAHDRQRNAVAVAQCVKVGFVRNFVIDYVDGKGRLTPVEVNAAIIGTGASMRIVSLCRDVTERKKAEELLRASEERHRTILQTAMDGIWLMDMQGALLEVNDAYCRMSGYSVQELLARRITDLDADQTADQIAASIQRIVAQGEARFEVRHRRKDGCLIDVAIAVQHRLADGGQFVVFLHDITERKRTEEEKARLEGNLQQAQKMEAVGRLAGGVAHDFNNLLMGIMGYTELCREKIAPDHPIREYLDEITHDAERSAEITRQLLAFARKQTIAPRILDLNDAVAGMLKLLRRLIGEDITLDWRPGANLRPVKLDPSQVDQILANLCVNSRDAIAGIGEIAIETGSVVVDSEYCARHPEAIPGAYVFLAVSDDGCGMDTATLAQVFEPFFTTKGIGKGTGLGLATVYGIVKQNNGFICATSEPGKGTMFKLYLPEIAAEPLATTLTRTAEAPRGRGETVLLVEDEKSLRVTCRAFLNALGYNVLVAKTPEEALQMTSQHHGDIHLLLTDVVMPGMDGRQLAKRIGAVKPGVKVLFMSGYTSDVIAQRGVLDEGVQFLSKPFKRDALARKVRQVFDYASAQTM